MHLTEDFQPLRVGEALGLSLEIRLESPCFDDLGGVRRRPCLHERKGLERICQPRRGHDTPPECLPDPFVLGGQRLNVRAFCILLAFKALLLSARE
ncbi:MAG: hypothetical protein ACREIP_07980, partial [Alphaproteobacteria bacterium]